MRVVAVGFATWGRTAIEALVKAGHEVALIVTHPLGDDSYYAIYNESVAALGAEHGIEVLEVDRLDGEAADRVRQVTPDLMVVSNWRTRIGRDVYETPTHGTLNLHDSLLPAYAGFGAPNWALINDEAEVGITAHFMDDGFDTGDILLQRALAVTDADNASTLFERSMAELGALAVDAVDLVAGGEFERRPQRREDVTYFHRRREEDGRIDWQRSAREVFNLTRAHCDPYPNAFCYHGDVRLQIVSCHVTDANYGGNPGRIFAREGSDVVIVAGRDAHRGTVPGVAIERVRLDGGTVLTAGDYFPQMGGYLTSYPVDENYNPIVG